MKARKHLLSLGIALGVAILVAAAAYWAATQYFLSQAEHNLQILLLSHRGIHTYIQKVMHPALYRLKDEGEVAPDMYSPELLSSSFIVRVQHAYYNQARREQGLPDVYYKMAATNPRNPVNRADEREARLIAYFNEHREARSHREVETERGRRYLYYATPFLETNAACLRCHGERASAPQRLQELYPGEGGFGDRPGRIRAIESVRVPIETEYRSAWIAVAALVAGLGAFGGLVFANRWLAREVRERTANLLQETADRKRAEEVLHLTQLGVDTMADAILWVRADGGLTYANDAACTLHGYTREELLGKTLLDLDSALTRDTWKVAWDQLSRDGYLRVETAHRRKDGAALSVEATATLLRHGGDAFGWMVLRDVTARKQLERQLLQAQKMEAIGTLAGGIAHDFNNILSAIRGFADLTLESLAPDAPAREDLRQVVVASDRARDLVRQILTFSRRDARERCPLQVGLVAKEALKLLRASLPATIEIRSEIDAEAWVVADPTGLHQIVMNLCTNAFHAMREKGGVLEVSVAQVALGPAEAPPAVPPGRWVRLRVRDTGTGMDASTRDRIFEPYFTTKGGDEGTGLGLSVVHGLVSHYGGAIALASEPGKGSTFDVFLPPAASGKSEARAPAAAPRVEGGTERVLLVDDEDSVRRLTARVLETLGYQVTTARDAAEALDLLAKEDAGFDLLLTDQTMPRMTGLALIAQARKLRGGLRAILMTGYSDAVQGKTTEELGVDQLVSKPFNVRDLGDAIRRALQPRT